MTANSLMRFQLCCICVNSTITSLSWPPAGRPSSIAVCEPITPRTDALRPLWEDAADILAGRLAGRTFDSWPDLIDAAEAEIEAMTDGEKAELLRGHPRLGESSARLRARSEQSLLEQGGGIDEGQSLAVRLQQLNDEYERSFGFPFVEWVAGRPLEAIVPIIEERLKRPREVELSAGCAAMVAIARDRLVRGRVPGA